MSDRAFVPAAVTAAAVVGLSGLASAADGVRVVAWNISNYSGSSFDDADIQTVAYAADNQGDVVDPDVFLLQEFSSQTAANEFRNALNAAEGSPGTWEAGPVFTGAAGSLNTAFVYRADKLSLLSATLVAAPGNLSANPRAIVRYDAELVGYEGIVEDRISFYPVHMISGSGGDDQDRRLAEANIIIADLPQAERHYIMGGDFNTQSSFQDGFEALVGPASNYNSGPFRDPIVAPGSWNNSFTFRNIHTQTPIGAGGFDDRLDMILLSPSLTDRDAFDYDGDPTRPWDLNTPEDPAHSQRVVGNDGTFFNGPMDTFGNNVTSAAIAQAIIDLAQPTGHAPLYLDLDVPPLISIAPAAIDLGTVELGAPVGFSFEVANAGDVSLWGETGIATLEFTPFAQGPLSTAQLPLADEAGGGGVTVTASFDPDAAGVGPFEAVLVVVSNASGSTLTEVPVTALVVDPCPFDFDGDGEPATPADVLEAIGLIAAGADFDGLDPGGTVFDLLALLEQIGLGCP